MSDLISRQAAIRIASGYCHPANVAKELAKLPSVQSEPCEDAVSRKAVEEMLKNGFPARGMWEIEGDVVKQTVCETLADALMDLGKLPSVQPDIIACADCKHWVCHDKRCGYWNHGVQPMMWCSQAERRWKE